MRTNATIAVILMTLWVLVAARADDQDQDRDRNQDRDYAIERNELGLTEGPVTDRILNGSHEVDGYRQSDGTVIWYDRLNVVGVTPPK